MSATPVLSGGNTAWVIMATALVMFMTVPSLAYSTAASFARRMS
jgi:ammonia channel protein AmtB